MHTQYETQTIDLSLLMCVCVYVCVCVSVCAQMVFCEYVCMSVWVSMQINIKVKQYNILTTRCYHWKLWVPGYRSDASRTFAQKAPQ